MQEARTVPSAPTSSSHLPHATYPKALEEVIDNPRCVLTPVWGPHYVSYLLRTCPII